VKDKPEKVGRMALDKITADPDLQPRAGGLSKAAVSEYAERATEGDEFPPLVVYSDGKADWLSEGFHRYAAYLEAGFADALVVRRRGTREDAKLNALASNRGHGLRRTNADKRKAVEECLKLRPKWSDRRIADFVGVDHTTVGDIRRSQVGDSPTSDGDTREGKDGKEYPVQVVTVTTSDDQTREGKDGKAYPAQGDTTDALEAQTNVESESGQADAENPEPEGVRLFERSAASIADDLSRATRHLLKVQEIVSVVWERPDLRHLAERAAGEDGPHWSWVSETEVGKYHGWTLLGQLYTCGQLDQLRDYCLTLCTWLNEYSANPDGHARAG